MLWVVILTALIIWSRYGSGGWTGLGLLAGMIIIGLAAENLLNTFWKDKTRAEKNRFVVRFWQRKDPKAASQNQRPWQPKNEKLANRTYLEESSEDSETTRRPYSKAVKSYQETY